MGSRAPLPQPLRTPRVVRARSRVRSFARGRRRGTKKNRRPARAMPEDALKVFPKGKGRLAEDGLPESRTALRSELAGEMVRVVVRALAPLGVKLDGVKTQVAPEGRPPAQARAMVEWKPPVGLMVRVTGLEVLPSIAVVEELEGVRVKVPTVLRTVSVAEAEVLAWWLESPE